MANGTIAASQLEMLSQSGTGIITITPPATNTNRAITLPDAAGAIVVSGTTPSLNGVTFPATQVASANANTLDDYEEGTFTPTVVGTTTAGTATYTAQQGNYTKIGNLVYVRIRVTWSGHTGTGNLTIAGLPFTSNGTGRNSTMAINPSNLTYSNDLTADVDNASTVITPFSYSSGGVATQVGMDAGADIKVAGCYNV